MAVDLSRTWCIRHGHICFERDLYTQQQLNSSEQSGCLYGEGATTSDTTAESGSAKRELSRQEGGINDKGRGRLNDGGR